MTDALWYLGRGSGVVALTLFTIVVALGIATRSGRAVFGLPRFVLTAVHRSTSLLAGVFLVIHVTTLLFDPYAELNLINLVIPFTSSYRPLWVGFGALALDLVVALVVTSLLRHRIGLRVWKLLHWSAYLMWPVAVVHVLGSGTDRTQPWLWAVVGGCAVVVLASVGWRLSSRFTENGRAQRLAAAPVRPRTPVEAGR